MSVLKTSPGPSLKGAGAHGWDCQAGSQTELWLQPQLHLLTLHHVCKRISRDASYEK